MLAIITALVNLATAIIAMKAAKFNYEAQKIKSQAEGTPQGSEPNT